MLHKYTFSARAKALPINVQSLFLDHLLILLGILSFQRILKLPPHAFLKSTLKFHHGVVGQSICYSFLVAFVIAFLSTFFVTFSEAFLVTFFLAFLVSFVLSLNIVNIMALGYGVQRVRKQGYRNRKSVDVESYSSIESRTQRCKDKKRYIYHQIAREG